MAKHSVFRDFVAVLRKHWRTELPAISPLQEPHGRWMPKASTFYAGFSCSAGMHVFIHLQHSCMAWEVGMFTVNAILSRRNGEPETSNWGHVWAPAPGKALVEGSYRIGDLLRYGDKWWHLRAETHAAHGLPRGHWRPATYDDPDLVFSLAAADVTTDVRAVLDQLGVGSIVASR